MRPLRPALLLLLLPLVAVAPGAAGLPICVEEEVRFTPAPIHNLPPCVRVAHGGEVTWRNVDSLGHGVRATGAEPCFHAREERGDIGPGDSYQVGFELEGGVPYAITTDFDGAVSRRSCASSVDHELTAVSEGVVLRYLCPMHASNERGFILVQDA